MAGKAFIRHTVEDFEKYSLEELILKRALANLAIQAAREGQAEGDPRADKALAHYRAERAAINGALGKLRYGEAGPPAQEVGLQPAAAVGNAGPRPQSGAPANVLKMGDLLAMWKRLGGM